MKIEQQGWYLLLTSSFNKGNRKFSVGNQESRMDHIQRLVVCRNNLKISDQLEKRSAIIQLRQTLLNSRRGWSYLIWPIYPAHGELQLQLCQPPADAHPLSDPEGDVGKRVDCAVLSQPALRLELFAVVEVVFAGAQSVAVYHQHRLQKGSLWYTRDVFPPESCYCIPSNACRFVVYVFVLP